MMPDGFRLHGVLYEPPPGQGPATFGLDAILCLHGTGSNFYSSSLWAGLIPHLLEWNAAVLAVNTRGHDGVSTAHGNLQRRLQGSAFEIVDECRFDVAGWVSWLNRHGYARIALLGHSLGALKALYSQAVEPQPAVRCIMAVSPPRLSHSYFRSSPRGPGFIEEYSRAEALVAADQGQTLIETRFPLPYIVTAAGYIDKYGPAERYNLLNFVASVNCPMLFSYGSVEVQQGIAFRGMPEELESLSEAGLPLEVALIAGADHVYSGTHTELASRLTRWARKYIGSGQQAAGSGE
jgi:pimeloyl-ACP methyl ester carboxylesterase